MRFVSIHPSSSDLEETGEKQAKKGGEGSKSLKGREAFLPPRFNDVLLHRGAVEFLV